MIVLREIIVFVLRTLFRLIQDRNTRTWPTTEGVIQTSDCPSSSFLAAEVTYVYSVRDERHFGTQKKAFWSKDSALDYATQFIPNRKCVVRYSQTDPTESFISEDDQAIPAVWETRYRQG